ncbi:MAG: hypothetical protein HOQ28_01515, partial [Thermoleophilia bacterium]|nr:hypothetical protein [Thermoleophilia bacterium]
MRPAAALGVVIAALAVAPVALAGVHVTVTPASVGLGDPFQYTVEARGTAAEKVDVIADAGPFLVIAGPAVTRTNSAVRVEQTLLCVDRSCAPGARATRVALPPARVTRDGVSTTAPAAVVTVVPRVPASAVAAPRARYLRQVDIPPPSTRISPALLAALLLAGAVAALAGALFAAVHELRRTRERAAPTPTTGGLERALRLLRESAGRP